MTTSTQSKVINSIIKATSGATVKVTSDKPSLTKMEMLDLVSDSGKYVLAYSKAGEEQVSALESLNKQISNLHNGGVRFEDGRKKDANTSLAKQALLDSLGDKSKSYKQDIWELFFKAVNSGKALKTLNKSRNAGKGAKTEKTEGSIVNVLVKLYNHSEFEDALSDEAKEEIIDILKREGCIEE
jgi:vacuolar-type H+-ATPase subunit I/STV1